MLLLPVFFMPCYQRFPTSLHMAEAVARRGFYHPSATGYISRSDLVRDPA
jgi:hypothetical protein